MKKLCGLVSFDDEEHWRKFITTIGVAYAFFNNGWFYGLLGPSLPDLQYLTKTDLQQVSRLLVVEAVGRLFGALLSGYLCDRTQKPLLLMAAMTLFGGLSTAALPWSQFYGVFMAVAFCCGYCTGGISCCGQVVLAKTWGVEGRHYFQFANFSYALGGIIAPLVATPFFQESYIELLNLINATSSPPKSEILDGGTRLHVSQDVRNVTNASDLNYAETLGESNIKYPFAISGGLFLGASVCLMLLLCVYSEKSVTAVSLDASGKSIEIQPLPRFQTGFFLVILFFLYISAASVVFILQAYLMTFAVRQMRWTRSMGALLTSVLWAAFAFGRLMGIFMARCLSPACMIYLAFSGMFLTTFGQFGGAYFKIDALIWAFVPLMSMSMSIYSPSLTVWIKENLISISGKIASFTIVTTSVAMMTFPLYLGYLIDKVSPMWFVYVQPIDCLSAIVLFTILFVGVRIARRVVPVYDADSETKPLLTNGSIQ